MNAETLRTITEAALNTERAAYNAALRETIDDILYRCQKAAEDGRWCVNLIRGQLYQLRFEEDLIKYLRANGFKTERTPHINGNLCISWG